MKGRAREMRKRKKTGKSEISVCNFPFFSLFKAMGVKAVGHRRGLLAALSRLAADLHKQNPNRALSSPPSSVSAAAPAPSPSPAVQSKGGVVEKAAAASPTASAAVPSSVVSARSAMDLFAPAPAPSPSPSPALPPVAVGPSSSSSSSSLFDIPAPASSALPIVDRKVKGNHFVIKCITNFADFFFLSL